ncbi:MAG: energy transducer TonB [Acidobacteriota bacterium]
MIKSIFILCAAIFIAMSGHATAANDPQGAPQGQPSQEGMSQEMSAYLAQVQAKIRGNWKLSNHLKNRKLQGEIKLVLSRDGNIKSCTVQTSSGNAQFDDYLMKAATDSAPFPPFPKEMPQNEEEIVLQFAN